MIAVHGWRSTWYKPFGLMADFWADNDCSVLYIEQRGQNESGSDYMGFGLTERFDCLDWAKWVVAECGTEIPIYLFGVSMGAATVMMSAGLNLPKNVNGIIADCGYTSPNAIWRHVSINNLHLLYGIRGQIAADICKQKIHIDRDSYEKAVKDFWTECEPA